MLKHKFYIYNQNSPLYMFYTRNKDRFKKTTAKVEHNEARKNIINLVKEFANKDLHFKARLNEDGSN